MSMFMAVWPITDDSIPIEELLQEAFADLPAVAARHRARIIGRPAMRVADGRTQPGSQGAERCIVARAEAVIAPRTHNFRNYMEGGD